MLADCGQVAHLGKIPLPEAKVPKGQPAVSTVLDLSNRLLVEVDSSIAFA